MPHGNYTPFGLCTLHQLDIFSSAPSFLVLSFWCFTLPFTPLLNLPLLLTNQPGSFASAALGPGKTGQSPCEATTAGRSSTQSSPATASPAWNHCLCSAFLQTAFTFSSDAEGLLMYMYVCIYTHTPHHRERPILQGLICFKFCYGLFLFCCSCGFRAGFVGLRESLDALGNVLQKQTFSPCILHSSHQVLKSLCTGFPLFRWTQKFTCLSGIVSDWHCLFMPAVSCKETGEPAGFPLRSAAALPGPQHSIRMLQTG